MTKGVKWVTLTPEERRMVQPQSSYSSRSIGSGNSSLAKLHICEVQLPDRATCRVMYQRDNGQWHRFSFDAPLHQRLYVENWQPSSEDAIEAKAQELAPQAYTQAQQAEQKAMQQGTPPSGTTRSPVPTSSSLLRPKTAQAQAGQYAVCIMFKSGNVMPLGCLHTKAETAAREWEQAAREREDHTGGQLVIGICCRWQHRWIQAQFVVYPQSDPNAETSAILPHPMPEPEPEEPEAEEVDTRTMTAVTFAAEVPAPAVEAPETPVPAPTKARSGRKRTKQAGMETTSS